MNTTSTDTFAPSSTPTKTPSATAESVDFNAADHHVEPLTFEVVDAAEPIPAGHALLILPQGEDEFRRAAEQAVQERLASLCGLGRRAVTEAIGLGDLLARTKERLGHGNWLPFLQAVGIKGRTAQNYLLLSKYQEPLRSKYANDATLTLTAALNTAQRLNRAAEAAMVAASATSVAEVPQETALAQREDHLPLLTLGTIGASLNAAQVEVRLRVARTIPPMKAFGEEDWAAFAECFRRVAATLHDVATEGIAGHMVADDLLFVTVEAMHKFLVKQRKEAGVP